MGKAYGSNINFSRKSDSKFQEWNREHSDRRVNNETHKKLRIIEVIEL